MISEEELTGDGSAGDAIRYGVANWHFENHDVERAQNLLGSLLDEGTWASFGYLAAESDWVTNYPDTD